MADNFASPYIRCSMKCSNILKFNIVFKTLATLLSLLILVSNTLFASNITIINGDENIVIDKTKRKIAVVGDNYAKNFEKVIGYNNFTYYIYNNKNNIYDTENVTKTFMALEKDDYNYVIFSLGSFETLKNYDANAFYTYMKNYIKIAERENKYVFLHTYMSFEGSNSENNKCTSLELDKMLKNLADEFANVFYIDMSNMNNGGYMLADGKNYNELFFQTLCAKLMYLRDNINRVQYSILSDWIKTNNENTIAVTGDSYAGTFVRFEKSKKYNILEFAKSGKTIGQNKSLIDTAMDSVAKYVLISTSVNDYEKQTTLRAFEYNLRRYINHALLNHKVVFLHTYMKYAAAIKRDVEIKDYDDIIKKLANEYDNTIYLDMHDYEKKEYQMSDKRHYDKEFNDALYEKIDKWIGAFRE